MKRRIVVVFIITVIMIELVTRLYVGVIARAALPDWAGFETNAHGFRDESIEPDKPLWLFLGDSTTFGLNLRHDQTFSEGVERLAGNTIQAVNAAIPGWGTAEQYDALTELYTAGFDFEVIILGFYANDPHNVMVYDAQSAIHTPSVFINTLAQMQQQAAVNQAMQEDWRNNVRAVDLWQRPEWQATRQYLDAIRGLADSHQTPLAVLYIPYDDHDVLGDSSPCQAMNDYAAEYQLLFINGVSIYRDYLNAAGLATVPDTFYSSPGDMGHPSVLSSKLLAQAIWQELRP